MKIEVVYALPERQFSCYLELPDGATAGEALRASGVIEAFAEVSQDSPLGVYGERVECQAALRDGDRLEIYRPLLLDPMQARRKRAERQRS